MNNQLSRVLIIGAGFGGVSAARALGHLRIPGLKITLVSDKPHLEYHPGLYRVVTGKSPLETCIPLRDIFEQAFAEVVIDTITGVDLTSRVARGVSGSSYAYDYLILAVGSETAFFDIPGLEKFSFGFKSITEALRLKRHLHELFQLAVHEETMDKKIGLLRFVVVGGGPSGVEFAGEFALYAKDLAKKHGVPENLITIDLIEGAPRILPQFSETISRRVAERLRALGINLYVNRAMLKGEVEEVAVRGMTMRTETIIWTAGVKSNRLLRGITGLPLDPKGRVMVDEFLRAKDSDRVFAIGDGAGTPYSGMAQTAIWEGVVAAENILCAVQKKPLRQYVPKKPYYALPVGPGWATALVGPLVFYGRIGWFFRRIADLRYFFSILSFRKALVAFRSGKTLCESCAVCLPEEGKVVLTY